MPAVRLLRSDTLFTPDQWRSVTRVSPWRGVWLVLHGWAVVALVAFGGALAWQWHWLAGLAATPLALALLGGRQLGLSILMHDAAHGLLHPSRRANNFLGQWLTGAATGSDLAAYRTYHLRHHKYTQQAEDPDLPLSAPFPTSRASLIRKVVRDLTGQTFWKQRSGQFALAFKGLTAIVRGQAESDGRDTRAGTPFNKADEAATSLTSGNGGAVIVAKSVGRFLAVQIILLALSLALWGWTPFLLWLAALATTFQLFLRLRNIAEHACTSVGSDDPFSHARTTRANMLERATVAPYWVNYHAEHHLFMGVPCYRLAEVHRLLGQRGHHPQMTIEPGYAAVLRRVTASA
ncbi:MAG: fatty acid desaturase family protein [Sphingopyxis sp.]|nr:fatty acid desaturase family protein [Sphingopyxis sp.]